MRNLLLAVIAASCAAAPPPAPAPLANRSPPATPAGPQLIVVSSSEAYGESSNMGGEHYVFRGVVDGRGVVLHGGAHGVSLGLFQHGEPRPRWFAALVELRDGSPEAQHAVDAGWTEPMPRFDGEVLALIPAVDAADAAVVRERLSTRGIDAWSGACVAQKAFAEGSCPVPQWRSSP
jgi:hypothetical protein